MLLMVWLNAPTMDVWWLFPILFSDILWKFLVGMLIFYNIFKDNLNFFFAPENMKKMN